MSANTNVLRDLDVCQSLFSAIEHVLENTDSTFDRHALAVLAQEGKLKLDDVVNTLAG